MDDLPAYAPQALSDILPIYRPNDTDSHVRIYKLRQTSASIQTLTLQNNTSLPAISYQIKANKTGGFMNRKPHIIISASNCPHPIAEGKFDIHGTGTSIAHFNPLYIQRLELENSQAQLLRTTIHGNNHWWQPYSGNKGVLELRNDTDEIVARFVPAAPVSQRRGSVSENKKDAVEMDLGELHVVDALAGGDTGREEILCSAVVVIERAKRRAMNICGPGLKGPASWVVNPNPVGYL